MASARYVVNTFDDDDDDAPPSRWFVLKVQSRGKEDVFDIELNNEGMEYNSLVIAPGKIIPRTVAGCMVMNFYSFGSKTVVIQSLTWGANCTKVGTLEKKYGTRRMLVGALLCARRMLRNEFPHLDNFELQDEAGFPCPPYSRSVKTFATDVFLLGQPYYARHVNMQPISDSVKRSLHNANLRLARAVDMSAERFWAVLTTDAYPRGAGVQSQSRQQLEWLTTNKNAILAEWSIAATWFDYFRGLQASFGCTFFACCAMRLVDEFRLNSLLGASWRVHFDDLPEAADGERLDVSWHEVRADGLHANSTTGPFQGSGGGRARPRGRPRKAASAAAREQHERRLQRLRVAQERVRKKKYAHITLRSVIA